MSKAKHKEIPPGLATLFGRASRDSELVEAIAANYEYIADHDKSGAYDRTLFNQARFVAETAHKCLEALSVFNMLLKQGISIFGEGQ